MPFGKTPFTSYKSGAGPMEPGSPVQLERSLPRAAYWNAAFYAREQQSIFWNQWMCAGRSADLRETGAYRVLAIAGEEIIVIRSEDGQLHGHVNLCRHRGSRLLCGEGITRGSIRCPYHGWAYGHDGRLVASPFVDRNSIPETARRLHRVAVDEWGGFFFVHLSPDEAELPGRSLAAQLGGVPQRLSRYPLEELRTAQSLRYDVAANWKVVLENYNECYHCAGVHPELCRLVPAFKHRGGAELDWERGIPHREGAYTFTSSGTTTRASFEGLSDDEQTRHKGELIYPNLMLSLSADHVAAFTIWPQNCGITTVVCDFLFAPSEIEKPDFDPSDAVAFWDLVNRQDWAVCENVQTGMRSLKFTHGYYAKMEDWSLDMRRYIAERLGADAVAIEEER
ncbi:MAG: aromatic ring-hydroxylating dioxygenase subunit alpha [Candidatus Eremiobacteraeota bacterium]|nr:aromatic ring-hydroxylating dioxygenase subunit alpha [Candidatus Eremiobacteraeota bacterium]